MNWVALVASFACVIPGCALLWRVYYSSDLIQGELYRQANYETCGFLFFWVLSLLAVLKLKDGKDVLVVRAMAVGVLLYITVYSTYLSFNVLNNLRIVDESNTKKFVFPVTFNGPVDRVEQRKLFGGLILGYFSLFFGFLATVTNFKTTSGSGLAKGLWFFALLLLIPGVVVSWTNNGAAAYPYGSSNTADYTAQEYLFVITTLTLVQFFVLTFGLFSAGDDLLASSAFIFGVGNLFAPVYYFVIQVGVFFCIGFLYFFVFLFVLFVCLFFLFCFLFLFCLFLFVFPFPPLLTIHL